MIRRALPALLLFTTPAFAREALGVTGDWGAFRDAQPLRCFAIAEPLRRGSKAQSFASVAHWPAQRVRSQIHFRLSREKRQGAPVTLRVDDRRFPLTGNGIDAWAPDARTDAAIVAAMRSGRSMSVATIATNGGGFADGYRLKGAATAIDAAALGCARVR